VVEFDPKELSRVNFRDKVIGPTDPKDAPKDSLRGAALANRNGLETFGVDADELDKINSEAKESGNLVKLGRGLYCAKLEHGGKGPYHVFNGFYMTVIAGFVKDGTCIYNCVVDFDPKECPG
jgi:hypothetical protein